MSCGICVLQETFSRIHPNLKVQTKIGSTLHLLEWLEKGQIDLAITQVFEADVYPTDVILKQDKLHWIKSPDFPIALQSTIPFIAYDQSCIYRKWATEQAAKTEHRLNTVVYSNVCSCGPWRGAG